MKPTVQVKAHIVVRQYSKQRPHSKVFFAPQPCHIFEEYFCTALSPAQALFPQPFNVSGINIQHSARGS